MLNLRDRMPIEIEIKQFQMVTVPDEKPIETVDVNKAEVVGVDKNENITNTNE
jgi:hypothetical protein